MKELEEEIEKLERNSLARECAKLDLAAEKEMADEGMGEVLEQWPEF